MNRIRRVRRIATLAFALVVRAGGWSIVSANPALGGRARGVRLEASKASPQWKDGRFGNSLDRQEAPFLKSFTSWARGAEHTAPDAPPAIEARGRGPGHTVLPASPPPVARWWPDLPWRTAEAAPVVSTGLDDGREVHPSAG